MTDRAAATTRRTALGMALGSLVAVAGCDAVSDLSPRGDPSSATTEAAPTLPPADADADLVDRVVRDVEATIEAVPQGRGLDAQVADLRDMHAAHRAALTGEDGHRFAAGVNRLPRREAVLEMSKLERAHQQRLEAAALEARSGSLAVLLAQMSAAVAQRLALMAPMSREGAA
ncbi:hypothetical protein NPS01_06580 [Nocardioides psychrotolerans]|uniref:DUF305 domain-containing protein n=1 Tax=Nocardioides psychrotolerans TaxID=1005945 RepID=A0A1I3D1D5_9ACTN|nr:hypothetical protein [Nocardioides psychrotolerans]GEP36995.1 hypothetical protein NPS01_06580 [Nocardioides psychrotolerans]SFH80525.1 hypothetical protein SAMN05216561_102311 [Nocardioides psychrotolerans]